MANVHRKGCVPGCKEIKGGKPSAAEHMLWLETYRNAGGHRDGAAALGNNLEVPQNAQYTHQMRWCTPTMCHSEGSGTQ